MERGQSAQPHASASVARWLQAGAFVATCAALVLLPLQGFGYRQLELFGALIPFDAVVLLAALLSLPELSTRRAELWRAPAFGVPLALSLAGVLSELAQGAPGLGLRLAEQAAPFGTAALVALHASKRGAGVRAASGGALLWAALGGALLALSLSLGGWLYDAVRGTELFSRPGPHPVFGGWPRLFGSFGGSPQRCGSFAVYALTLLLAARQAPWPQAPAVLRWGKLLAGLTLLLSLSYAWIGGMLLGGLAAPRRWRRFTLGAAMLAVFVASVPMSLGPASEARSGACSALDAEHYLVVHENPGQCLRLSARGRAVTRYTEAKRAALEAFRSAPWFGVGYRGFPASADAAFQRRYGASGAHYEQPHGIFHGLPAKHGLCGLLALCACAWLLRRGYAETPFVWGVLAFLAIGVHIDVDRLRELWVLFGFLAAEQLVRAPEQPARTLRPP